nr:WRKY transcription factor [Panax notoginseng]
MTDTSPKSPNTEESTSMEYSREEEQLDIDRGVLSTRLVLPEDGFEWRKYGQKFIKNIGKTRSYFKCQKSNCIAKKKVEWSVSEPGNLKIVYEAEHNHLSPRETSTTTTAATANPYDLLTQVLGDNQTSTSSYYSLRRHA